MNKYNRIPNDEEMEQLMEEQEPVYSMFWDSGGPGAGADAEEVYRWGDKYIVRLSYDGYDTLYPSLLAAIEQHELFNVSDATKTINSSELSADEIGSRLRIFGFFDGESLAGLKILINGEPWQSDEAGKFSRV